MTAPPLPMDRAAVIERMAEAKWEQYREVDGHNRVSWAEAMDIHKDGVRAEVAVYLNASGLLERVAELEDALDRIGHLTAHAIEADAAAVVRIVHGYAAAVLVKPQQKEPAA